MLLLWRLGVFPRRSFELHRPWLGKPSAERVRYVNLTPVRHLCGPVSTGNLWLSVILGLLTFSDFALQSWMESMPRSAISLCRVCTVWNKQPIISVKRALLMLVYKVLVVMILQLKFEIFVWHWKSKINPANNLINMWIVPDTLIILFCGFSVVHYFFNSRML